MTRRTGKWSTRDMTAIALMAVLMCLCTWIAIPGPVPFTLQTFAVFTAMELLGKSAQELEFCRLVLEREGGKEIVILNFGTHPDVVGGRKFRVGRIYIT